MQLKDFITETLKEIVDGVRDAQNYTYGKGARVSPKKLGFEMGQGLLFWDQETDEIATMIEFDVAVTTTEGTGSKGGIGVFIGAVGLGSQAQSNSANSSVSRIKFTVPVILPKV